MLSETSAPLHYTRQQSKDTSTSFGFFSNKVRHLTLRMSWAGLPLTWQKITAEMKSPHFCKTHKASEWRRIGQLTRTGHFTQIPSGKADECNGDFSPIDNRGRRIRSGVTSRKAALLLASRSLSL
jgi:hypothetical protein